MMLSRTACPLLSPPPTLAICLPLFVVFAIKIIVFAVEKEKEAVAGAEEQVRALLIESTGQTETESVPLCEWAKRMWIRCCCCSCNCRCHSATAAGGTTSASVSATSRAQTVHSDIGSVAKPHFVAKNFSERVVELIGSKSFGCRKDHRKLYARGCVPSSPTPSQLLSFSPFLCYISFCRVVKTFHA